MDHIIVAIRYSVRHREQVDIGPVEECICDCALLPPARRKERNQGRREYAATHQPDGIRI
jgi:hypothetical protein